MTLGHLIALAYDRGIDIDVSADELHEIKAFARTWKDLASEELEDLHISNIIIPINE